MADNRPVPVQRYRGGLPASLFGGFGGLQGEINRMFDEVWRGFDGGLPAEAGQSAAFGFAPRMDVSETETAWHVELELPGLEEKDVSVEVQDGVLTVEGEKKQESERDERNVHVSERSYGRFRRALRLPPGADVEKVSAAFKQGVLAIEVPKAPEAQKQRRRIAVSAA